MGEYVYYTEEGEAYFPYTATNTGRMVATPENSQVFLHDFEHRGLDHVFTALEVTEDNKVIGAFLWRVIANEIDPDIFDKIIPELEEAGFEVNLMDEPIEGDVIEFERFTKRYYEKVKNKKIQAWLDNA